MAWTLTQDHEDARALAAQAGANAFTLVLADTGSGPSTMAIYDLADPQERTLLATITLARPCGQMVGGKIQLAQASSTGDIVLVTGVPTWAEWLDGDGELIATCTVSSTDGTGDLKISSRADGYIFAGGFITLAEGLIG